MEFDFFAEVCEMMGFLNGTWEDIPSVCTLLHQLLECILLHDIYQVRNGRCTTIAYKKCN